MGRRAVDEGCQARKVGSWQEALHPMGTPWEDAWWGRKGGEKCHRQLEEQSGSEKRGAE